MRALVLTGPRQAELRQVADPTPAVGEVLVRIRGCGVCASDLNAWRGVEGIEYPLPAGAPGHEFWGEVESGQLVTGLLWNGFAELGVARPEHLTPIESPLLGEPLACAANVVQRARIEAGQRVAIVGFGYLAALVAQLLPAAAGGWIVVSRRPESRALALELGAEAALDFPAVAAPLWDSFPVVIEATGVQQGLDFATWLTGYGGRLVVAGYHADGPRTVNMQTWNWKGLDVINAHERQPAVALRGLEFGLALARERGLDLHALVSHTWTLEDAARAFEAAESRPAGFVKGVLQP